MSDRPEHDARDGEEPEDDHAFAAELMALLDPDPEDAETRYWKLWADLTWYLERRRCYDPDGSASEAVRRAIKIVRSGKFDPSNSGLRRLVFGIATKVCHEGWRRTKREQQPGPGMLDVPDPDGSKDQTRVENSLTLDRMRPHLDAEEWRLLERYYTEDDHAALAGVLKVKPGALRVRIHRVIRKLRRKLNGERKQKKA